MLVPSIEIRYEPSSPKPGQKESDPLGWLACCAEPYENFVLVLGEAGAPAHASSTRDGVRVPPKDVKGEDLA